MKNKKNVISCRIYDIDNDGFISSEELTAVLKMMVGTNLNETQIQQIVDKTFVAVDKVNFFIYTLDSNRYNSLRGPTTFLPAAQNSSPIGVQQQQMLQLIPNKSLLHSSLH